MKFEDLYNRVFLKEQEENEEIKTDIADPADFDDVEPAPVVPNAGSAETSPEASPEAEQPTPVSANETATLTTYINDLHDFANKLLDVNGDSLLSIISRMDNNDTPFENFYDRTNRDIENAAQTLKSIAGTISNFLIHATKKR